MSNITTLKPQVSMALPIITRDQMDLALAYPRDVKKIVANILEIIKDPEIAEQCFYCKPTKTNKQTGEILETAEGPSVRLSELIEEENKNINVLVSDAEESEKSVTVKVFIQDLEKNKMIMFPVTRSIFGSYRYSQSMIDVTKMAASAIAYRNAIFKFFPKVYVDKIWREAKRITSGNAGNFEEIRKKWFGWFLKKGISNERLLKALEKGTIQECTENETGKMIGWYNAIQQEGVTLQDIFPSEQAVTEKSPFEHSFTGEMITALEKAPEKINSWMRVNGWIGEGQTYNDIKPDHRRWIVGNFENFLTQVDSAG